VPGMWASEDVHDKAELILTRQPRHVSHLEHRCISAGGTGSRRVANGCEIGCFEPDPLGIGLNDLADTLIGKASVQSRPPLATSLMPAANSHDLMAFTGQVVMPRAPVIVSPWPAQRREFWHWGCRNGSDFGTPVTRSRLP
jgi:hypothetical protein